MRLNDRFLRACRSEPVDATPVWFMRQAGRSLPEYRALRERYGLLDIFQHAELMVEVVLLPVRRLGVDAAILFADITLPFAGMGVRFEFRENVGPVLDSALRTAPAIRALRPFEPEAHVPAVLDAIKLITVESSIPLIGFAGAPFTLASYLIEGGPSREFARTKGLMLGEPETWALLMDRLTEATVAYLRAQVRAGVHAVQLFDSWVGVLSPGDYRKSVLPYSARVFEAMRALEVPTIHFSTGTAGMLDQIAAAGGDVIGVDWRLPLDEAWDRAGSDRGIQGNLDPAVILAPFDVVADRTTDVLRRAAGRPGHIFNLGHGVLPESDPDTLRRLVDLVHTYRHPHAG